MCLARPDVAEPFAERLGLLTFSDAGLDSLRRGIVEALADSDAIDETTLKATLMKSGLGPTLDRIYETVKPRGRPSALVGDAVDAAEWLLASIEERERVQAGREMLERARGVAEDDAPALDAVDVEAIARAEEARARSVE